MGQNSARSPRSVPGMMPLDQKALRWPPSAVGRLRSASSPSNRYATLPALSRTAAAPRASSALTPISWWSPAAMRTRRRWPGASAGSRAGTKAHSVCGLGAGRSDSAVAGTNT